MQAPPTDLHTMPAPDESISAQKKMPYSGEEGKGGGGLCALLSIVQYEHLPLNRFWWDRS